MWDPQTFWHPIVTTYTVSKRLPTIIAMDIITFDLFSKSRVCMVKLKYSAPPTFSLLSEKKHSKRQSALFAQSKF